MKWFVIAVIAILAPIGADKITPHAAPSSVSPSGSSISKFDGQKKADDKIKDGSNGNSKTVTLQCPYGCTVEQPQPQTQEEKAKAASLDRLYRRYMFATIIGVIGGLIGVGLIFWQTILLKQSVKATKKSADAALNAQRAWILVESISPPPISSEESMKQDEADTIVVATFVWNLKVYGNTPTRIVEAGSRFHIVDSKTVEKSRESLPDLPDVPKFNGISREIPEFGKVFISQEPFQIMVPLESGKLGILEYAKITRREKFICAYGFVKYRDAFEGAPVRETRFCHIYQAQLGGVLIDPTTGKRIIPDGFRVGGPSAYNQTT